METFRTGDEVRDPLYGVGRVVKVAALTGGLVVAVAYATAGTVEYRPDGVHPLSGLARVARDGFGRLLSTPLGGELRSAETGASGTARRMAWPELLTRVDTLAQGDQDGAAMRAVAQRLRQVITLHGPDITPLEKMTIDELFDFLVQFGDYHDEVDAIAKALPKDLLPSGYQKNARIGQSRVNSAIIERYRKEVAADSQRVVRALTGGARGNLANPANPGHRPANTVPVRRTVATPRVDPTPAASSVHARPVGGSSQLPDLPRVEPPLTVSNPQHAGVDAAVERIRTGKFTGKYPGDSRWTREATAEVATDYMEFAQTGLLPAEADPRMARSTKLINNALGRQVLDRYDPTIPTGMTLDEALLDERKRSLILGPRGVMHRRIGVLETRLANDGLSKNQRALLQEELEEMRFARGELQRRLANRQQIQQLFEQSSGYDNPQVTQYFERSEFGETYSRFFSEVLKPEHDKLEVLEKAGTMTPPQRLRLQFLRTKMGQIRWLKDTYGTTHTVQIDEGAGKEDAPRGDIPHESRAETLDRVARSRREAAEPPMSPADIHQTQQARGRQREQSALDQLGDQRAVEEELERRTTRATSSAHISTPAGMVERRAGRLVGLEMAEELLGTCASGEGTTLLQTRLRGLVHGLQGQSLIDAASAIGVSTDDLALLRRHLTGKLTRADQEDLRATAEHTKDRMSGLAPVMGKPALADDMARLAEIYHTQYGQLFSEMEASGTLSEMQRAMLSSYRASLTSLAGHPAQLRASGPQANSAEAFAQLSDWHQEFLGVTEQIDSTALGLHTTVDLHAHQQELAALNARIARGLQLGQSDLADLRNRDSFNEYVFGLEQKREADLRGREERRPTKLRVSGGAGEEMDIHDLLVDAKTGKLHPSLQRTLKSIADSDGYTGETARLLQGEASADLHASGYVEAHAYLERLARTQTGDSGMPTITPRPWAEPVAATPENILQAVRGHLWSQRDALVRDAVTDGRFHTVRPSATTEDVRDAYFRGWLEHNPQGVVMNRAEAMRLSDLTTGSTYSTAEHGEGLFVERFGEGTEMSGRATPGYNIWGVLKGRTGLDDEGLARHIAVRLATEKSPDPMLQQLFLRDPLGLERSHLALEDVNAQIPEHMAVSVDQTIAEMASRSDSGRAEMDFAQRGMGYKSTSSLSDQVNWSLSDLEHPTPDFLNYMGELHGLVGTVAHVQVGDHALQGTVMRIQMLGGGNAKQAVLVVKTAEYGELLVTHDGRLVAEPAQMARLDRATLTRSSELASETPTPTALSAQIGLSRVEQNGHSAFLPAGSSEAPLVNAGALRDLRQTGGRVLGLDIETAFNEPYNIALQRASVDASGKLRITGEAEEHWVKISSDTAQRLRHALSTDPEGEVASYFRMGASHLVGQTKHEMFIGDLYDAITYLEQHGEEPAALRDLLTQRTEGRALMGYNIRGFDLPVLQHHLGYDPGGTQVIDLFNAQHELRGTDAGMDVLAGKKTEHRGAADIRGMLRKPYQTLGEEADRLPGTPPSPAEQAVEVYVHRRTGKVYTLQEAALHQLDDGTQQARATFQRLDTSGQPVTTASADDAELALRGLALERTRNTTVNLAAAVDREFDVVRGQTLQEALSAAHGAREEKLLDLMLNRLRRVNPRYALQDEQLAVVVTHIMHHPTRETREAALAQEITRLQGEGRHRLELAEQPGTSAARIAELRHEAQRYDGIIGRLRDAYQSDNFSVLQEQFSEMAPWYDEVFPHLKPYYEHVDRLVAQGHLTEEEASDLVGGLWDELRQGGTLGHRTVSKRTVLQQRETLPFQDPSAMAGRGKRPGLKMVVNGEEIETSVSLQFQNQNALRRSLASTTRRVQGLVRKRLGEDTEVGWDATEQAVRQAVGAHLGLEDGLEGDEFLTAAMGQLNQRALVHEDPHTMGSHLDKVDEIVTSATGKLGRLDPVPPMPPAPTSGPTSPPASEVAEEMSETATAAAQTTTAAAQALSSSAQDTAAPALEYATLGQRVSPLRVGTVTDGLLRGAGRVLSGAAEKYGTLGVALLGAMGAIALAAHRPRRAVPRDGEGQEEEHALAPGKQVVTTEEDGDEAGLSAFQVTVRVKGINKANQHHGGLAGLVNHVLQKHQVGGEGMDIEHLDQREKVDRRWVKGLEKRVY